LYGKKHQKTESGIARNCINDFRKIRRTDIATGAWMRMLPSHYISENKKAQTYVKSEIKNATKELIVMTHWCPHKNTLDPVYAGSEANAYFVNHHPSLFRNKAIKLWVHGHSHTKMDIDINGIRTIRHPRGYPHEGGYEYVPKIIEL
jgi:hypothetical protein